MAKTGVFTLLYLTFFSIIDILCSTVFYCHGNKFSVCFVAEVRHFDVTESVFELWIFSALRFILHSGTIIGVWRNPADAITRIENSSLIIFAVSAIMWSYAIIKMLLYSETDEEWHKDAWFWCLFSWSIIASIMLYIHWTFVLLKLKPDGVESGSKVKARSRTAGINNTDDDMEQLVDDEENAAESKEEEKEDNRTKKESAATVARLLSLSRPDLPYILAAFFFLLVACAAETFIPLYTGNVIQGIAIERDRHKFTMAIIYLGLFSIASAVATGLRAWLFKLAMSRLNIRIRKELFFSIVHQEVGFFDTVKTGEISSRLQSDTTIMSESLGLNVNIFLRSLIKAFGVIIFMVKLSWRLSMVTLIGLPIITSFSAIYGSYYEKLSKKVQDALAKSNEVAEETCSSVRTVRSFASERQEARRYGQRMADVYKLNVKEAFVYAGYVWSNFLFALSLTVATLYYGGTLVLQDALTGGALVSFILYQEELGNCIENIGYVYTGLMQAAGASSKVFEYIDRKPKLKQNGDLAPTKLHGKLEFRDVSFAYPSRPDTMVLKGVSFMVKPGEVVALVGPSGGGKSSCVNLLEHFYETCGGQVLLDDVPIQQYDHKYLHQQISLVGQEPVLFARSIKENIAYGLEDCDFEAIQKAAKMANAHHFIEEMKEKYDTEAGEKGVQLSGGQKQRIAIARAIIRKPAVLLLDEATSALDSESEHVVQQALYNNLKERTVLIIAHRLSTVENASRIVVIDKGQVVEQGSHAELLANNSIYSQLVKRQLLGVDSSPSFYSACENESESAFPEYSTPQASSSIDIHKPGPQKDTLSFGSFKSMGSSV